jgi:hypothetical protein
MTPVVAAQPRFNALDDLEEMIIGTARSITGAAIEPPFVLRLKQRFADTVSWRPQLPVLTGVAGYLLSPSFCLLLAIRRPRPSMRGS